MEMFRSARFKLTLFYLTAVLAVSLSMSLGTRWLAQHEYEHSNLVQRGAFRGVVTQILGMPWPEDRRDVFRFQQLQEQQVRAKLNQYVLIINFAALVIGGLASYWFAGRTLRPIEEAHEAQKRFASDASHELRTPLTAMKTENEVFLRQKDFTKSEARLQIQSNLEEVDRLEKLSSNLLALTEYENAELSLRPISIEQLVDDALLVAGKTYPEMNIKRELQPAQIMGDHGSLVQLVGILVDNAHKYGQGKPITVKGELHDSVYRLQVIDKGPGIPAEDLPYIFDRLYRGDKARSSSTPGHGLGLALAQRIAYANHAGISAQSDKGAVFTVELRVASRRMVDPKT